MLVPSGGATRVGMLFGGSPGKFSIGLHIVYGFCFCSGGACEGVFFFYPLSVCILPFPVPKFAISQAEIEMDLEDRE